MSFITDIILWGMENLEYILTFLWITAIVVYLLKFVWPWWDNFTRYGKLEVTTPKYFTLENKVGWMLFYSTSCLMFFATFIINFPPNIINIQLFMHSFRRLLESIFVTKWSQRKMHIINFLAGSLFYFMTPFTIATSSKFHIINPFIGIVIICILNILQFMTHRELASLKKYSIPKSFLFKKIASPHYFLEILLYLMYFLQASSVNTFLMLCFVITNLTHAANLSYNWNVDRFGDEFIALHRNVIVPYVY